MRQWLPTQWYAKKSWIRIFAPLAGLYRAIIFIRKKAYQLNWLSSQKANVPVIVVGNITVGGTGKTPLVMQLARDLQQAGFQPGIISRGYLSHAPHYPYWVDANSSAIEAGDEALEMHLSTNVPVVIAPKRVQALDLLLQKSNVNVVLADDGLQHYALNPSLRIGVIDGERRFGNGWCLPVGPCREPKNNWEKLDIRVCNGNPAQNEYAMQMRPVAFLNVKNPNKRLPLEAFSHQTVRVMTGIGNPQRFLTLLDELQIQYQETLFSDHHAFTKKDFSDEKMPVIMTGKDAAKCREFAEENWWYLLVEAEYDPEVLSIVQKRIVMHPK